jgi:predicted ATPase
MGYPDSGADISLDGVRHAEVLNHPVSLILGLRRACMQRMMQGDTRGVIELSERLLATNAKYETFLGSREGAFFDGWAKFQLRPEPALLDRIQTCIKELDAAKFWAMLPFFMTSLAELTAKYGDTRAALALLDRADELTTHTDERWCKPEIFRLRASFGTQDPDEAVGLLQAGLGIAKEQRAKLWELRSAVTLARLCLNQGKRVAAREALAPILATFTEGFGTPDISVARALLDELPCRCGPPLPDSRI